MTTTTLRNADLAQLGEQLQSNQDRRADYVVPAGQLASANGILRFSDGRLGREVTVRPGHVMLGTMASRLDIPTKFYRGLVGSTGSLTQDLANLTAFDSVTNARLIRAAEQDRSYMLRTFTDDESGDHYGRALLSDRYAITDNFDVLMATLSGIEEGGHEVRVVGCDLTETRMRVRVVSPAVQYVAEEWLKGYQNPFDPGHSGYRQGEEPIVFAGFEVSNSEVGAGAFSIVPRIEIQICRNGARLVADEIRDVHLGGRLEAGQIAWSETTRKASLELVKSKTTDAIRRFLSADYLEETIKGLETKGRTPVERPAKIVEVVGEPLGWSESEREGILDRFIKGSQLTATGMLNAVTAHAQDIIDPERAAELEEQGVSALMLAAAAS